MDPYKGIGSFDQPSISPLYTQGMNVSELAQMGYQVDTLSQSVDYNERFWASPARHINDPTDEILIIKFSSSKLLNYIHFEKSAFPHLCSVWYLTDEPEFLIGIQREVRHYKPLLQKNGQSIRPRYTGSIPYVVNRAETRQAGVHPHHFGAGHWMSHEYDFQPVRTQAIAIVLNRNLGSGQRGPVDPENNPVPYSLGIRNLDVGYRVASKEDVPYANRDPQIVTENESFTQVVDVAGSMVELKMRENRAEDLLRGKIWRSEPQPISYGVVNLYVDSRDDEGNAQVIDRFYIDPVTSGPHMNLYYANEVPSGTDFASSNNPFSYPLSRAAGPGTITTDSTGVRFPNEVAYVDLSNKRTQWNTSEPFWVGMDIQPFWEYGSNETHVLLDAGAFRFEYHERKFRLVAENFLLELDYDMYDTSETDPDPGDGNPPEDPDEEIFAGNSEDYRIYDSIKFFFGYDGREVFLYTPKSGLSISDAEITSHQSSVIRFGAPIGDVGLDFIPTGNFRLNSFVLKKEALIWADSSELSDLTPMRVTESGEIEDHEGEGEPLPLPDPGDNEEDDFSDLYPQNNLGSTETQHIILPLPIQSYIEDPVAYNTPPAFAHLDDHSTQNALIRMIPSFITQGGEDTINPFGFTGGPANFYEDIEWTPITRDYKLRQGELQFYPTKAKFFKFEFTNLTPQPYEVYSPVRRNVKVYASDVEKASSVLRQHSASEARSVGLDVETNMGSYFVHADSIRYAARQSTGMDVSPVEAIYAKSAREKERLDSMGSMYTYHPWHPSSQTPRIQATRKHYYEKVEVSQFQRIAYFVGLSQLLMYRLDYHVDDDTPEYVENFGDTRHLDPASLETRITPGHTNYIIDPSFEFSDINTYWTQFSEGDVVDPAIVRISENSGEGTAIYGAYFAQINSSITDDPDSRVGMSQEILKDSTEGLFPLEGEGDRDVMLSLYARGRMLPTNLYVSMSYYDGASLLDQQDYIYEIGAAETLWTRYRLPGLLPEEADRIVVSISSLSTVDYEEETPVEFISGIDIEGVQLEVSQSMSSYVDGDFDGAFWLGTPHESASQLVDVLDRPWTVSEDRIETPSQLIDFVTLESSTFHSRRKVKGVQFASTQSSARQLLNDAHFRDHELRNWNAVGDALTLERADLSIDTLPDVVKIERLPGSNLYGDLELGYETWGSISESEAPNAIYESIEGEEGDVSLGGIQYNGYNFTTEGGRVYAAARVYAPKPLSAPLSLQIIDRNNSVLAESTIVPNAGGITEWYVPYTPGEVGRSRIGLEDDEGSISETQTWGDIERMDPDPNLPTYGDLELYTWRDLIAVRHQEHREVSVRVVQLSSSKDVFYVDNISLFEDAIKWEFSNDGGRNWYPGYGIRNNPDGVLIFPPVGNPSQTSETRLRWRVTGYRPGLFVSNVTIRPWYGGMTYGIQHRDYGVGHGPNQTPTDQYSDVRDDPFFQNFSGPIPQDWFFAFRQMLLKDQEFVPITVPRRNTLFGNLYGGYLDPDDMGQGGGLQDQYTSTYGFSYGNPSSDNAYVNFYDPVNQY